MSGDDEDGRIVGSVKPGAEVISLPVRHRFDAPIVLETRDDPPGSPGLYCRHQNARVYLRARMVKCRDCGARLDAIFFLARLAEDWDRVASWARKLRAERGELEAEVVTLKAERNRLRSSVKGLRGRRGES